MLTTFVKYASRPSTIKKGLMVSLVVGTILNAINQGDLFLHQQWGKVSWFKLILTFITPFLVSVYSTTTTLKSLERIPEKKLY